MNGLLFPQRNPSSETAMKRFAVRILEGSRPHLRIINADNPDDAAREVVAMLDGGPERLLGARIAVWKHGTLHKNMSPLFIKSVDPFEVTPDIHVVQAIREKRRRERWMKTQAVAVAMKEKEKHQFEEPYERWLESYQGLEGKKEGEFFSLPSEMRHECLDLREHLRQVSPGDMTDVQACFAAICSSFGDLYRYEAHATQERLAETVELIHHRIAGMANPTHDASKDAMEEVPQLDRLAKLIGIPTRGPKEEAGAGI